MRQQFTWLVAAALVAGSAAVVQVQAQSDQNPSEQNNAQAQQNAAPQLPNGAKAVESADIKGMNATVAAVTTNAMKKENFDDLVKNLVDEDRNRVGNYADQDMATLDGRIDQLQKAWKSKYNEDFDFDKGSLARNEARQGEITDPNALAEHWPVPVTDQAGAQEASAQQQGHSTPNNGDSNIQKGRNIAILYVPGEGKLPALTISMVHEAGGWKIDVPNTRTGKQIHDDLLTQLTELGNNTQQWPSNKDDAYRLFAHHVLMAIYGVQAGHGQA